MCDGAGVDAPRGGEAGEEKEEVEVEVVRNARLICICSFGSAESLLRTTTQQSQPEVCPAFTIFRTALHPPIVRCRGVGLPPYIYLGMSIVPMTACQLLSWRT